MQVRPRALDLLQLAQTVLAKVINSAPIVRLLRVHAELPVEQRSREPQLALQRERAIGEPQVEVEAAFSVLLNPKNEQATGLYVLGGTTCTW